MSVLLDSTVAMAIPGRNGAIATGDRGERSTGRVERRYQKLQGRRKLQGKGYKHVLRQPSGAFSELESELFDCRIVVRKATVPIRFLLRDLPYELQAGQTFYLREVKRIGEGKIVTVFEP